MIKAQSQTPWADSVLLTFRDDVSKKHSGVRQYADTLCLIYDKANNPCRWIEAKLYRSYVYRRDAHYTEALASLFSAHSKLLQTACNDGVLLSEIYLGYAQIYEALKEPVRVKYYIQKGIDAWPESSKNKDVLIRLYLLKGVYADNLRAELYYYQYAYNLAGAPPNLKMREMALNTIGTYYAINGDNKRAMIYLKQALVIAKERKAYSTLPSLYNNLAGITDDPELIEAFIDSSYHYALLSGALDDQETALQNKAYFKYADKEYKVGYDYLWEAMELKDSLMNEQKIMAFAEMEQKYESEKKSTEIALLKGENEIANLRSSRRLVLSLSLGVGMFSSLILLFIIYKQGQKRKKLNSALQFEKKKSDDLLLNILPVEIADELKQKGAAQAKQYEQVTVLFTDFVNFTGVSMSMTPTELVEEINRNFTAFDAIMDEYGLEKIKTIGDAYLAVCGLPNETPDHAQRVVKAALAIQHFMKQNEGKFQIRMGVHTGPVVAGIVGVKKYAYDIWGDTVNTAARMEQHSEAGKVNISETTYALVKTEFNFTYRGKIQAKNKGEIDMYFVG
jgi:class 3 adenylate cyclase